MSDSNAAEATPDLPLIHWVDTNHVTRDPVSAQTLLDWIDAGHLPTDTPAWWQGLDGWTTAVELRAMIAAPAPDTNTEPAAQSQPTTGYAHPTTDDTQPTAGYAQPTTDDDQSTADEAQPTAGDTQPTVEDDEPTADDAEQPRPTVPPEGEPADQLLPAPMPTPSLTAQFDDQELDDTFMALVERSSEIYEETERATSMDEVFLGGVIAALGDSGFVLIDVVTGGSLRSTPSSAGQVVVPPHRHELRFEEPASGARVALVVEYLTPDAGSAKLLGQRARIQLGYGEQVPDFGQVGRALRQEMASTFVVSPEPGRVTFDADLSSEYVYCQVDLLLELDRYVDDSINVDADLLRKHVAATVHTLRKFLQLRFAG